MTIFQQTERLVDDFIRQDKLGERKETIAPQFNNWSGLPLEEDHPDFPEEKLHYYRC